MTLRHQSHWHTVTSAALSWSLIGGQWICTIRLQSLTSSLCENNRSVQMRLGGRWNQQSSRLPGIQPESCWKPPCIAADKIYLNSQEEKGFSLYAETFKCNWTLEVFRSILPEQVFTTQRDTFGEDLLDRWESNLGLVAFRIGEGQ